MKDRKTWHAIFLDDDADLCETVVELLQYAANLKCYAFAKFSELVQNESLVLQSALVILDINLGPSRPNGLDAYQWLNERRFQGKIAFLTGHARSNPLVSQASQLQGVEVLDKPVELGKLLRLVEEVQVKHSKIRTTSKCL